MPRAADTGPQLHHSRRCHTLSTLVTIMLQKRNTTKGQRSKENRTAEAGAAVAGPEGDTEWEKAISLINFGFGRPNGTDLARFKSVLFSAKSKNVPTTSAAGAAKA